MKHLNLKLSRDFDNMKLTVHQVCGIGYDSNVYFLATKKPILIDTGTGWHKKEILENLKKLNARDKIEKIILTHNHVDHSGGAAELCDELGVEVYAHKLDGTALVEGDGHITGALMFGREQAKVEVSFLSDGETIDCGDTHLRVHHTPGHSPGSISLYDEGTKSLFCGDLVFMDGGVGRWDLPGGNHPQLVQSYEQVMELDIDNFYSGHGPVCEGNAKENIALSYRYLKSCEGFA